MEEEVLEEEVLEEEVLEEEVLGEEVLEEEVEVKTEIIYDNEEQLSKINEQFQEIRNFRNNMNTLNSKKISNVDDTLLPSPELDLSQATLELMKNPLCVPLQVYVERWKTQKKKYNKKNKIVVKEEQKIDDSLLPSIHLSFPVASNIIKSNPKCVPFEVYIKRWNELKVLTKHKKRNRVR